MGASQAPPPPQQSDPYGGNQLFSSPATPAPPKAPFATPVDVTNKIKPGLYLPMRTTPRSSHNISKLRFAQPVASPTFQRVGSPSLFGSSSGRQSPGLRGLDDNVYVPNAFVSKPSVKKLIIEKAVTGADLRDRSTTPGSARHQSAANGAAESSRPTKVSWNADLETATPSSNGAFSFPTPARVASTTPAQSATPAAASAKSNSNSLDADGFASADYVCDPPIEQLLHYPAKELARVDNFTISRPGHGKVRFTAPV